MALHWQIGRPQSAKQRRDGGNSVWRIQVESLVNSRAIQIPDYYSMFYVSSKRHCVQSASGVLHTNNAGCRWGGRDVFAPRLCTP